MSHERYHSSLQRTEPVVRERTNARPLYPKMSYLTSLSPCPYLFPFLSRGVADDHDCGHEIDSGSYSYLYSCFALSPATVMTRVVAAPAPVVMRAMGLGRRAALVSPRCFEGLAHAVDENLDHLEGVIVKSRLILALGGLLILGRMMPRRTVYPIIPGLGDRVFSGRLVEIHLTPRSRGCPRGSVGLRLFFQVGNRSSHRGKASPTCPRLLLFRGRLLPHSLSRWRLLPPCGGGWQRKAAATS